MSRRSRTGAKLFSYAILAGTLSFAVYAESTQMAFGKKQYDLSARFVSANGLSRGADVDMGGIPVGRVTSITLDPASQMAIVNFRVNAELKIPDNSQLTIGSPSLSANNALIIEPGNAHTYASAGSLITSTQEPSSLEQQVSNYIFGAGNLGQ
ncbi:MULTISPECIES: MlaD family protein [Acetobacter]|uniref:MlaD family protein n=1 Tax=Acetobacter thailandicus TaxID=1502842 RepID=A0ABT3QFR4_9PROT|nr:MULTISPECIES: MlaD family protein [Acetobacter]MBS0959582.1 MCE family protein [Acetobacter thailandicus]MBS0985262.1 MCE family protein [Acetobacter thailandicus]MBS1002713.1 MCE family protein [Acetobacter thailandicus]MCX2564132.1 MlaD family protein [Acetobacter thailandicus]NHN95476.1 MCE family protein [Acetobacter thailandicus]